MISMFQPRRDTSLLFQINSVQKLYNNISSYLTCFPGKFLKLGSTYTITKSIGCVLTSKTGFIITMSIRFQNSKYIITQINYKITFYKVSEEKNNLLEFINLKKKTNEIYSYRQDRLIIKISIINMPKIILIITIFKVLYLKTV